MDSQPFSAASATRHRNENYEYDTRPLAPPFKRQTANQYSARYRTSLGEELSEWESSNFEDEEEETPSEPGYNQETYFEGEPPVPNRTTARSYEQRVSNSNNNTVPNTTRSHTPSARSRTPISSSSSPNLAFPTVEASMPNESATEPEGTIKATDPGISETENLIFASTERQGTYTGNNSILHFPRSFSAILSPQSSSISGIEQTSDGNNANINSPNITTAASPIPDSAAYIGQLRVMIVGDSGVGKTAFTYRLLRAIERFSKAQTADANGHPFDIWDSSLEYDAPQGLTEYLASTAIETRFDVTCDDNETYVPDDLGDLGDPSDRPAPNVAVLDTPGYGETATPLMTFKQVTQYLHEAFARTRAIYASAITLQELQLRLSPGPSSGAHELIDVIVYLVHRVKRVDVAYLRQLAPYAFVLPCMMYEGSPEPQAVNRARADVRKSYERLGVTWHKRKGMMFNTSCDERDTMMPFVIHRDALTDDEGPADDFGELCDLLFRTSRLDWWRHWNVVKFIDWLRQQRKDEGKKETEALNTQEEPAIMQREQNPMRRQQEEEDARQITEQNSRQYVYATSHREDAIQRQEEEIVFLVAKIDTMEAWLVTGKIDDALCHRHRDYCLTMSSKAKQTTKRKPSTPQNSPSKSTKKHASSPAKPPVTGQRSLEFFFANQRQRQLELEQEAYGDSSVEGEREVHGSKKLDKDIVQSEESTMLTQEVDWPNGDVAETRIVIAEANPFLVSQKSSASNDTHLASVINTQLPPTVSSLDNQPVNIASAPSSSPSSLTLASTTISLSNSPIQLLTTDIHLFEPSLFPTSTLWPYPNISPYSHLVTAFTLISGTTSRTAILNILTNAFRVLLAHSPDDLLPSIWLCSNAISPPHIGLELGVGPQILTKAITGVSGITSKTLKTLYEKHGDWGDVAFAAKVSVRTLVEPKPLTIRGVYASLRAIAALKGPGAVEAKAGLATRLLLAAQGEEARYLTRTLVQHLRIGAVRTTVLIALARACVMTMPRECVEEVQEEALVRREGEGREATAEKMKRAEAKLRECYARCPNWDGIVPWLVRCGDVGRVAEEFQLTVGVPLRPMLGKITRDLSEVFTTLEGREFTCEFKYDGQRAQIHLDSTGKVKIFSRHLEDITDKYPDVVALIPQIIAPDVTSFVMDAEVVAVDEQGRLRSFQVLSNRARKNVEIGRISVQVCIHAFDLMYLNSSPLLTQPLRQRRSLLRSQFCEVDTRFRLVQHMDAAGSTESQDEVHTFFRESLACGCEGIMVKVLDHATGNKGTDNDEKVGKGEEIEEKGKEIEGNEKEKEGKGKEKEGNRNGRVSKRKQLLASYEPDKRLESWLKVKKDYVDGVSDSLDLVPIGAWYGNGRKAGWYSPVLLALYNPENETYESVCKCMSGFSDAFYKELLELYTRDNGRIIDRPKSYYVVDERALHPDVWFEPWQVWEIKGADITLSPVHKASLGMADESRGLSLRFPRFVRRRDDKTPEDATTSAQMAEMFMMQSRGGDEEVEEKVGEEEGWVEDEEKGGRMG